MTTEELLKLVRSIAHEGSADPVCEYFIVLTYNEAIRLCDAVAAEEREECASICDGHDAMYDIPEVRMCADAIRGRNTND